MHQRTSSSSQANQAQVRSPDKSGQVSAQKSTGYPAQTSYQKPSQPQYAQGNSQQKAGSSSSSSSAYQQQLQAYHQSAQSGSKGGNQNDYRNYDGEEEQKFQQRVETNDSINALKPVVIIKDRLCWISSNNPPRDQPSAFFFNVDSDLQYEPFFADFGPHNLSNTYRFVTELEHLLAEPEYQNNLIFHYTGMDSNQRTNAAYLMGAFMVIILGRTAEQAWAPFSKVEPPFSDYRDAGYGPCTYKCTILDCLRGLEYGIKLKWFNVRNFQLRDYEYFERVENGDLNEIIPEKFIAFSGPSNTERDQDGYRTFTPEDYVPIFKKMGVTLVIRLNKKAYDAKRFTDNGIKHLDLYFLDGSCPPDDILAKFLSVCEKEKGKIAVHCKAGLGRTGSLIAMYAMKHYHFPAADFIGWIRIARPGSILGPQQYYLNQRQMEMWEAGKDSPIWKTIKPLVSDMESINNRFKDMKIESKGEISPEELKIASQGEKNQGEFLVSRHKTAVRK